MAYTFLHHNNHKTSLSHKNLHIHSEVDNSAFILTLESTETRFISSRNGSIASYSNDEIVSLNGAKPLK